MDDKIEAWANDIIREVAELPDRNSPEGQPEMMLVSADELRSIMVRTTPEGYRLADEREYEALRKDAERLDYIASNARCDPKMDGMHVWWPTSFEHRLLGGNLREAIDNAIKEQSKC